jgi:predicted nucleic acid-binding protein
MKVLIDTNIIIDVLAKREPFLTDSAQILRLSEGEQVDAFITANSVTDIIYILRKHISDQDILKFTVQNLFAIIDVVDVLKVDILKAFELNFKDFEDALQARCAKRIKADYIITRNPSDFKQSSVPALTPAEFLSNYQ